MKKDIILPKVKDVYIAVIPEESEAGTTDWYAYLINNSEHKMEGVLVSSRGYGEIKGEQKKTATFRHSLDELEAFSYKKIEPVPIELMGLNNEFWLSFYVDKKMYDKKYIFLAESIAIENCINTFVINKPGVVI